MNDTRTWLPETEESYKVAATPDIIVEIINHSRISVQLDESEDYEDSGNYFRSVVDDLQRHKNALDECGIIGWKVEDNCISYDPLEIMIALSIQDVRNGVIPKKLNMLYISD